MATTKLIDRQYPLAVVAALGVANLGPGNEIKARIPPEALLIDVKLVTAVAFDSATTATGTISDGTTTFVDATDLKTAGLETTAVATKFYPVGGEITISLAQTGAAATLGQAIAVVQYVVLGRGNEIAQ